MRTAFVCLLVAFGLSAPTAAQQAPPDTLRFADTVDEALRVNFQIQIARNEAAIADNDASIGNAGFLPVLTATGGYNETVSDTEQTFVDGSTQNVDGASATRTDAGAELRWTLFEGLGRFATYDRLGEERRRQEAATRERVEVVLSDVVEAYYDVARQQQQLQVFREAVAISRERLRIAELRRDLGSASDLDVRQARVDLNADSADVLRQRVALTNTKAALNALLGRRGTSTQYAVTERIDLDTTLTLGAVQSAAASRNPVLQQAERSLRIAEAEQREVRSTFFPTLDATLGYGYSQLDAESGFVSTRTSYDWSYGLSLSWDVFDGLNRVRQRENAALRARNAELAIQDVRAQLEADLTSAYESYRNRLQLVALERQNLDAAAANVDVALERFRLGTITSVELRDVQEQLVQAESRLLVARFEAKQAEIDLLRLSGQLLDVVR